jgi:hypothetical protein
LEFIHPKTGQLIQMERDLPTELQEFFSKIQV